MTAEIIIIGDEILIGQVVDTNSTFIGKALTKIGVEVCQIKTINDHSKAILAAVDSAVNHSDLVVITGGLGPTNDDLTKKTLAAYYKDEFVVDQEVLDHIKNLFKRINEPILPANLRQAEIPSSAKALQNKYGTAPGMWFEKNKTILISLPGVPYEMKALMADEVIPRLKKRFKLPYILQKTILTYGMGESRVAQKLETWEAELRENMSLAYLPNPGRVRLRLTAKGLDQAVLKQEMDRQLESLEILIGDIIGGYEGESSLAQSIAEELTKSKKTIATAESCTGGRLAKTFTAIPGASSYYKGGIVPYFTQMKIDILEISETIIQQHSVVSAEVASAMAKQVRLKFNSDYGLATTGNAGPSKGDSGAELGTVYIALAKEDKVIVKKFNFGQPRIKVVKKAVQKSLEMIKENIFT